MVSELWQKVDSVLDLLLDAEPESRDRVLAQACEGDDSLRQEVERLLKAYDSSGQFIESPPVSAARAVFAPDEHDSLIGRSLLHYVVLQPLGAGGMGRVYLARDTKLGRRVAIKLMPAGTIDAAMERRFQQEARAASALNHPNILTIYEVHQQDEPNFIVSEYVEGVTLRERLRHGLVPLREALDICIQIAGALSTAHGAGIVHRDVKPENVMVRTDGLVKVLDFGLAKLHGRPSIASESGSTSFHTNTGLVMGTVNYMSPEQARGEHADYRSDIFGFGVLLYELVTGRMPFKERSQAETLNAVINQPHVPAVQHNSEVTSAVSRIIDRALAKDPADRQQSMSEVLDELQAAAREFDVSSGSMEGAKVHSGGSAAGKLSSEWVRIAARRPWLLAASVLFVAIFLAVLFLSKRSESPSNAQIRSIAVLPFRPLDAQSRDESLELGIANTLISRLSNLKEVRVLPIDSVRSYANTDIDPLQAGKQLKVEFVLSGIVQRSGDQLRMTVTFDNVRDGSRLWQDVLDHSYGNIFTVQDAISERVVGALALKLSGEEQRKLTKHETENPEAYQACLRGRYHLDRRTPAEVETGRSYYKQAISIDPNYALAYAGLAESYILLGGLERNPNDEVPLAKKAVTRALELDSSLAEAHATLAAIKHLYDWDFEGAEAEFKISLSLKPDYTMALRHYGLFLVDMGRFEEALANIKESVAVRPVEPIDNRDLGQVLFFSRRYAEAKKALEDTLELDRNFATAYLFLTRVYEVTGSYDKAVDADLQVESLFYDTPPQELAMLRAAYHSGGWRGYWEKKVGVEKSRVAAHREDSFGLVRIYSRLGETDQVFFYLDKALQEHSVWIPAIRNEPLLDYVRSDARFEKILQVVKFPPQPR
jgi:serine/threonine protein kinase/Tfp pilus assembly protein PilF